MFYTKDNLREEYDSQYWGIDLVTGGYSFLTSLNLNSHNPKISSFDNRFHYVDGEMDVSNNALTDLFFVPTLCNGSLIAMNNMIADVGHSSGCEIDGNVYLQNNLITKVPKFEYVSKDVYLNGNDIQEFDPMDIINIYGWVHTDNNIVEKFFEDKSNQIIYAQHENLRKYMKDI